MAEDLERQVDAVFQAPAKVYCQQCHWYLPERPTRYGWVPDECLHSNARDEVESYKALAIIRRSPGERNGQNDCTDWQCKTFWSDVRRAPFKLGMLSLALVGLIIWLWRMMHP